VLRSPERESVVSQLWRNRLWILPGIAIALCAVIVAAYDVSLFPPSLKRDSAEYAAASTQVMVDVPGTSAIGNVDTDLTPLVERANVYSRLGPTPAVLDIIGRKAGITPSLIDAKGPYNPGGQRNFREPSAERRSTQIRAERNSYRLRFDSEEEQQVPIVSVYAEAPTTLEANRLADSAAAGLRDYVVGIQRREDVKHTEEVTLRQLGRADGGVVNPGVDRQIAMLTFISALAGWTLLVLLVSSFVRWLRDRAAARAPVQSEAPWELIFDSEEQRLGPPTVGSRR
jgi:hypothetical protein